MVLRFRRVEFGYETRSCVFLCAFCFMSSKNSSSSKSRSHYQDAIMHMMFTQGDGPRPLEECQDFLLNIIHEEMQKIVQQANVIREQMWKGMKQRKSQVVLDAIALVYQFRRQPMLLFRLITYIRNKESQLRKMEEVGKAKDDLQELEASTLGIMDNVERKMNFKYLRKAVESIDVNGVLMKLFDRNPTDLDETELARSARQVQRVRKLPKRVYSNFCRSRQWSFFSKPRKKNGFQKMFLDWIAMPRATRLTTDILHFCAKELVAMIVDSAALIKENEPRAWTALKNRDGTFRTAQEIGTKEMEDDVLQLRHYREAIRRVPGRNKPHFKGCMLFAYF
ncbi:hypothetical protein L596_006249 [Steinernema carpocapsae]|uniref:Uncharacterized protein n=2 Tax=Steinernema carpocapsae TaxID=34508 RepID=A0A4U8V988_STECR|nr:hypothetical protein L596_006249 [Steinernema carpocapsae]